MAARGRSLVPVLLRWGPGAPGLGPGTPGLGAAPRRHRHKEKWVRAPPLPGHRLCPAQLSFSPPQPFAPPFLPAAPPCLPSSAPFCLLAASLAPLSPITSILRHSKSQFHPSLPRLCSLCTPSRLSLHPLAPLTPKPHPRDAAPPFPAAHALLARLRSGHRVKCRGWGSLGRWIFCLFTHPIFSSRGCHGAPHPRHAAGAAPLRHQLQPAAAGAVAGRARQPAVRAEVRRPRQQLRLRRPRCPGAGAAQRHRFRFRSCQKGAEFAAQLSSGSGEGGEHVPGRAWWRQDGDTGRDITAAACPRQLQHQVLHLPQGRHHALSSCLVRWFSCFLHTDINQM